MENFEDFEMRPLTSGLGFRKQVTDLKQAMTRSNMASEKLQRNLPTAPPPEEMDAHAKVRGSQEILTEIRDALKPLRTNESVKFSTTLPRPGEGRKNQNNTHEPEIQKNPSRDPLAGIDFQIPNRNILDDDKNTSARRGAADARIRPLVAIPCSISSALVDAVTVTALSMIFLAALVSVTQIEVSAVMASAKTDLAAQIALAVLFLAVMQIYLILGRSFFGRTLGEWTFDVQLGEDQQIEKATYPIRVLFRSILNVATGLVALPILSFIVRRDIAGLVTGLRLYRQNL